MIKKVYLKGKLFFICLFAIVMVATGVAVFNFNLDIRVDGLSDLKLANIEALAQNENDCLPGSPGLNCPIWNVTHTVTYNNGVPSTTCTCSTGGSYTCPC